MLQPFGVFTGVVDIIQAKEALKITSENLLLLRPEFRSCFVVSHIFYLSQKQFSSVLFVGRLVPQIIKSPLRLFLLSPLVIIRTNSLTLQDRRLFE